MDIIQFALAKKLVHDAVSQLGSVFNLKGTVASVNQLPSSGNKTGDVYLVGPQENDSYDEYYYSASSSWELLGSTIPDMSKYVTKESLYAGAAGTGTISEPAAGTILDVINMSMRSVVTLDETTQSLIIKGSLIPSEESI